MKNSESTTLDMLLRVRQFGLNRVAAFPAGSYGAQLLTTVADVIAEMRERLAEQAQQARAAREKTTQKQAALDALRETMKAITRTARAMALDAPGLDEKFRPPADARAESWIAAARAFASEAELLQDEFFERGMADDFLDDLRSRITAVELSVDGRSQKSAARVCATASVVEAAKRGRKAVRDFDPVVRNIYSGNEAVLAEWESASHLERAARRAETEEPTPEPALVTG